MTGIIYEFDPVIYPFKLWVVVNKSPNHIADIFKEYNGKETLVTTDIREEASDDTNRLLQDGTPPGVC